MSKITIVYYSMYGNVYQMAEVIAEGVREVEAAEVEIKRVPELIPDDVIKADARMKAARDLQQGIPVAKVEDLGEADGIIIGTPTRFGNMCAQMRNFWDRTSALWMKGALIGKPVGAFCSTASLHGGQEMTLVSMMPTFLHHGMIIVGVPYSVPELLSTTRGGTPYGPSHQAGPQSDWALTDEEKVICRALGHRVADITKKLAA